MPIKSKSQFKFMQAAAHDPELTKKVGIKSNTAKEMVSDNVGDTAYKTLPVEFSRLKKKMKESK